MDGKDIQSDLHALKRLYGLLRKDGGEASDSGSDSVIAGQAETSRALPPAQLHQLDETAFEERPTPRSRLSLAVEGDQSSNGRLTSDWSQAGATEQSIHRVPSIGLRHGQKRCRVCQRNTVKQLGSRGETHFHEVDQNTYADHQYQQNSVGNCEKEIGWLSSHMSDDSKYEKRRQRPSDLNVIGDAVSSNRMATNISKISHFDMQTIKKAEVPDCLSQEASIAIKQIESCMSALRMGADHLDLFEKTSSSQLQSHVPETESAAQTKYDAVPSIGTSLGQRAMDDFVYPMHQLTRMTAEEGNKPYLSSSQRYKTAQPTKAVLKQSTNKIIQSEPVPHADILDLSEESTDRCRFQVEKVNKIYVQNLNAIVEKIEPGNWIVSSNGYVPGGVALIPNQTSYTPCWPATSSASKIKSPYQNRTVVEDEESKPSFSFTNPKNHPPVINKKVTHLLASSGFHGNQSDARDKVGVGKDRCYTAGGRTSLQNQESDGTTTDSYSSWSSQQTSSHDSNSEDYSVTDGSREPQYVTSSKSSGSWDTPLSHGSGSQYNRYKSYSEEDVYSSSSGEGAREATASSSSRNEEYSSYEQPIRSHATPKHSTSKKSGPSKIGKAYGATRKKQTGILKRLKDRLAVVFHHHHHHHHHNRGDHTNNDTNTSRSSSLDKHKEKAVSPKRQDDAHGAKAVEKIGKSKIGEKRQKSHFGGLMGGLVRHVQHSKKSKRGKGTSEFGQKRTVKKSHWWKLLQHHQRSKLHQKAHLKLGLGKKKPRLKALS